jgi:hypothetical protein
MRSFRVNLTTAVAIMLALWISGCGGSSLPSLTPQQQEAQDAALAMLKELGAEVVLDEEHPDQPILEIYFLQVPVTDQHLEKLRGLAHIQLINLHGANISDVGLEHLKELDTLVELMLNSTKITDAGVKHLEGLSNLKGIYLKDTRVTQNAEQQIKQAIPGLFVMRETN